MMSRPDIALGVKPIQLDSPVDSMSRMLTLKSLLKQGELQDQQGQMNKLAIDEGQVKARQIARAEKGTQTYADAMKNAVKMNDDGTIAVDHGAIEKQLIDSGFPELADAHRTHKLEAEKVALESAEKELTMASMRNKQLAQFAQSVLNAPEQDRPRLYMGALNQAVAMKLIPPDQAGQLPKEYTPEVAPMLQQMADHGKEDPYAAYAARIKEKRDQAAADMKLKTDQVDLDKKNVDKESTLLGGARGQEAWAEALRQIPEDRRHLYPDKFSEEARKNAVFMGMTPEQRDKIDKVSSDKELAMMAAKGDPIARAALKILGDNEIRVDAAKEMNKQKALMSAGLGSSSNIGETPATSKPNPDVLAKLPSGIASDVKLVSEYKRAITPYMLTRSPYWSNVSRLASEYDHNFDPSMYDVRMKMRQDFTGGKTATALRSLNTVAQHLNKLNASIDKLDNYGGDSVVSTVGNMVTNTVKNKEAQKQVSVDVSAVANELENAYRAGGGSEQGVQAWKHNFSLDDSKDVQKNSVREAAGLVEGLIASLKNQYEKGMGRTADFNILDKKARETFKNLGVKVDEVDPEIKTVTPAPAAPKVMTEELIRRGMASPKNKGATRDDIIKALLGAGYTKPNE